MVSVIPNSLKLKQSNRLLIAVIRKRTARTVFQKNDVYDALAVCETALRPGIHFVAIKTIE
ncbi:TPA: hypothetical protein ACTD02_004541 [Salmonella enterica subsp. enterica serovar Heidelberg]|uniref:hypothetical protein n=1 Tax=Salmonella enterica TaxID=28901 RepID=UPI0005DBDF59|nr:hypothetical protein [Salmonella enterica]EHW8814189.1 hypothetical protein [Salmonella enterica subsp. enterica serovar Augustenborg]HEC5924976.1 hypothetical protein [Salmonella enterica subsp. enterica serovar Virchow]HEC7026774.1 hypothetical protein [Salmonella enterica subsp. enterica serovar Mgulani]EHU8802946.1 hypothetical protein [Salmonella enterica]EHV5713441.1 hypothetical protein [Salmonella enterica]